MTPTFAKKEQALVQQHANFEHQSSQATRSLAWGMWYILLLVEGEVLFYIYSLSWILYNAESNIDPAVYFSIYLSHAMQ